VSLLTTAATRSYRYRVTDALLLYALKRRKAQKQRSFRAKSTHGLCIKDEVLIDPACGSGNFLTETYLSMRRIENEVISELQHGQIMYALEGMHNPILVSISQFYGIEINDFAVTVAKTALWIAESQMMQETESIIKTELDFLPLTTNANIVEGNALRMDWNDVVPASELNYIMGNPPFVGSKYSSILQKQDMDFVFENEKKIKYRKLDYVSAWYWKFITYTDGVKKDIKAAFVSTNSITQGEQPSILWNPLFEKGIHIDFAYRTFRWDSEANEKAHVHCVIIGFSMYDNSSKKKVIYDSDGNAHEATQINGYLLDGPNILVGSRQNPISANIPKMAKGSQPTDGGNLLLSETERDEFIKKYPKLKQYIRRYMGASDLINNKIRYCFWLKDCPISLMKNNKEIMRRLELVKQSRLSSTKKSTRKWAERPFLFTEDRQPDTDYLILPVVSSERRRYLPIGYVSKDVIANTNAQMMPNASLYNFGILESNVHMAWMRTICGRMKSDYSYSIKIVYNNFPWPTPTDKQKALIEKTAQGILDARDLYPDSSLADLYDPLTMPPELRKAHQMNDRAVMQAYGFSTKMSEADCVAELMKMYQQLTAAETKKK
jgi:hypothetical protein